MGGSGSLWLSFALAMVVQWMVATALAMVIKREGASGGDNWWLSLAIVMKGVVFGGEG